MAAPLLHLAPPSRGPDPAVLDVPGGFVWWYVDLTSGPRDGVVLIWSFGLPFLPGYLRAARDGRPQRPRQRPSLNVAVYRDGRPELYLLQEYGPDSAHWDGHGGFRFGDSTLGTAIEHGRRVLSATLDCPVPGSESRLTGHLRVEGPATSLAASSGSSGANAPHRWSVLLGPSLGVVDLRMGDRSVAQLHGRAYFDRNAGSIPFDRLGIEHWLWGRIPQGDRELVYYLLWPTGAGAPEVHVLSIDERGHIEPIAAEVELAERRLGVWGVPYWRAIRLRLGDGRDLSVEPSARVDDGPFYLRFFTSVRDRSGSTTSGTCELVRPRRVDRGLERPLVRMRVHRVQGPNSRFLPLFAGPSSGRVGRLIGGWMRGGAT